MRYATRTMLALLATVLVLAAGLAAQKTDSAQALLRAATDKAVVDGDLNGAIKQFQTIVDTFKTDRAVVATALVRMADCYQKLGDRDAQKIYERLLRDFGDQKEAAAEARTRLAALQPPAASQTKQAAREIWTGGSGTRPSPDGRYLPFTDATGNVAVRDLSTSTNRRVTNTGGWASGEYTDAAVMSRDGRQVAWVHYVDKENKVELRVASMATGEPARFQVVLRTGQDDGAYKIDWMPDGKQLQVIRRRPDLTSQIGTVTIQDGSFRNIKSLEWRNPNLLSVSPDGRYVAYDVPAGEAGSPRDILVLATDGSRETAVVQNPANDSFPLWSSDGSRLVFLSDRTGTNALWMVPIEDGRPNGPAALIKSDVGSMTPLGLTKSGALYYFSVTDAPFRNLYVTDLDAMRVTKPPAAATERLINANIGPAWSRDGEYLAYYSFRNTSIRLLVIRSAKTGEERTVPLPTRVASAFADPQGRSCCQWAGPKWFPDNRSVLVQSGDAQGSGFGFYRLALDTGNTELLAHLRRNVSSYDLSPDGRTIFYAIRAVDGQSMELMRFDIDSHRETELRNDRREIVSLAVSPDGMQLATTLIGGVVEVRPAAGGQSRELFRPASFEMGTGALRQALAWTPDQRFLLWVRGDGALWKVPALGGKAEKVDISMGFIKNLAVRPDGKQIVFDAGTGGVFNMGLGGGTAAVWALENFLPAPRK